MNLVYKAKPVDPRKPVIRGRASICEVTLQIKVLWRNQLDELIRYLTDEGHSFEWEVKHGDSVRPDEFFLTINGVHWAYNVTAISKILEGCDYQDNLDEQQSEERPSRDTATAPSDTPA